MSFWRTPENEDEPMGACSQSVACRSPEVCRSVAEESSSNESQKAIVTGWIPDVEFLNNKLLRNSSSGMTCAFFD